MTITPTGYSIRESDSPSKHTIELRASGLARIVHLLSFASLGISERGSDLLEKQYGPEIKRLASEALRKLKIDMPVDQVAIAWDRNTIYGTYFSH